MFSRRRFVAIAAVLPLSACKIRTINYFPTNPATVRYINLLPNAGNLDIVADSGTIWANFAFEQSAGYVQFEAGQTKFSVQLASTTTQVTTTTAALAAQQPYTLLTFGTATNPLALLLGDTTLTIPTGVSQFRIFHAAIGLQPIDAYFTAPDLPIIDINPQFAALSFSNGTIFTQIPSGTYQLRLCVTGTKVVIYDSGPLNFPDTIATNLFFYSRESALLGNMATLQANGPQTRGFADNKIARLKAVNAAVQSGPVNLLVDGTAQVTSLAVGTASLYRYPAPGSHALAFEATATPGAAIATVTSTLNAATDSTVVVAGLAGSTVAFTLADNNLPASSGNGRLRFVNASPDAGPLDVFVNDVKSASGVAYTNGSGYTEIPANTVTIRFVNPTTAANVLTVANVPLQAGQTFSVYAIGPVASIGSLVTQDNLAEYLAPS